MGGGGFGGGMRLLWGLWMILMGIIVLKKEMLMKLDLIRSENVL